MKLTQAQRAALTSALSHPASVVTAAPKTAAALRLRGLIVGRKLTKKGHQVANEIGTAFALCSLCGKAFETLYTLPTDRVLCHTCLRKIGKPIMDGPTFAQRRVYLARSFQPKDEQTGHPWSWKRRAD